MMVMVERVSVAPTEWGVSYIRLDPPHKQTTNHIHLLLPAGVAGVGVQLRPLVDDGQGIGARQRRLVQDALCAVGVVVWEVVWWLLWCVVFLTGGRSCVK